LGDSLYKSSALAEMGDSGHNRHRPKKGVLHCPFRGGSWVPVQHNVVWSEVYFHTKWRLHPFSRLATLNMGRKLEGCAHFRGGSWDPI